MWRRAEDSCAPPHPPQLVQAQVAQSASPCQHDMGSHSSRPEPERGLIIGPPRVRSARPQAFGDAFCSIQAMLQTVIRSVFFFFHVLLKCQSLGK